VLLVLEYWDEVQGMARQRFQDQVVAVELLAHVVGVIRVGEAMQDGKGREA